jgi:hypothetical protein
MANTYQLYSASIRPVSLPAYPPRPIQRRTFVQRTVNGFSTDTVEWREQAKNFAELMDLRRALYSQQTHGIYRVRNHGEVGEGSFVLVGPKCKLLIEYAIALGPGYLGRAAF